MAALQIIQIPVLNDNYVYVLHEPESALTAVVDPAVADPVEEVLANRGWKLTHILNTHHHGDHTGANLALKETHGCTVIGPAADAERIPGIDVEVGEGDEVTFGQSRAYVFDVPGHTRGHIAFWFRQDNALFCGDTLFAMGCGRMFEGTAQQFWSSLSKLRALPAATKIYCAHEYTMANGQFALSVEPENQALIERMEEVARKREKGIPTVPSTLREEWDTNPFLRPNSDELQRTVGLVGAPLVDVFAETRRLKDNF